MQRSHVEQSGKETPSINASKFCLSAELFMAHSLIAHEEPQTVMASTANVLHEAEATWHGLRNAILNFDVLKRTQTEQQTEIYNKFIYVLDRDASDVIQLLLDSKRLLTELRQKLDKLEDQLTSLTKVYLQFLELYYNKL